MKKLQYILPALFLFIGLAPAVSNADTAILLNENTVLFTVDFSFNTKNSEYLVPVGAKFGHTSKDSEDYVGFSLFTDQAKGLGVTSVSSIVLSKQAVDGIHYKVGANTMADFTLFTLVSFDRPVPEALYKVGISELPYYVDGVRTRAARETVAKFESPSITLVK